MNTTFTHQSKRAIISLSTLLLTIGLLTLIGCADQSTQSGVVTDTDQQLITQSFIGSDDEPFEETMQISPFMINLQSKGAAESIRTIIGLYIPGGYYITDFDFTLSFNDEDVIKAYDCYYCYVDNNLIISFNKDEVLSSPVTLALINSEAVAAINGYFRVESDEDGYDTWLSRVARVEIISPAHSLSID